MPKMQGLELKAAIDEFLAEFSAFETHFVGLILRSLSTDLLFVKQTEALLDLEARLKLLKRMAFVRNLDPYVIAQLDAVNLRAGRLREKRDELSRNLTLIEMDGGKSHSGAARTVEDESMHRLVTAGLKSAWLPTKPPTREMKVRKILDTTLSVDAGRAEAGSYRRVQQQMVDAQTCVAPAGIPKIIPVAVDPLLRVKRSDGIDPALL